MQTVYDLLSALYLAGFAASGFMAARLILPRDRFIKQLAMGFALGLVMLVWLPVLPSFFLGFCRASQHIGLALAVVIGVACALPGRAKTGGFDSKKDLPLILTCLPIIVFGAALFCNHTITAASNGSLHVGQCTYGDLCMHLGFISSISVQETFPPMYSILPGTPLGYPFLCDSVSSTFYTLGASLRFAALLPAIYAFVTVTLGVYLFFEDWLKRPFMAVTATVLFFIGGGFGFAYFFDNAKTYASLDSGAAWSRWLWETRGISSEVYSSQPLDMGRMLMEGWYKTPTNFVDNGLRWVNSIADMLLPQRATLFGWALLFPALQLLRRAAFDRETKLFIPLGIVAGAMPLVHTHSFFALGLISAFLFAAFLIRLVTSGEKGDGKRQLMFLLYGVIAVALAAPQLLFFTFRQSSAGGFLKLHFNWCNESDSWLWFYIKNLGLIFILMLPAFLAAKKDDKLFYGGALTIWALCEFVVFQPNTYDNNKLLFVWFAMTCGLAAQLIVNVWDKLTAGETDPATGEKKPVRTGKKLACGAALAAAMLSMTLSGAMTLAREYVSGDHWGFEDGKLRYIENGYEVVTAEMNSAAKWINENAPADATVLTATNHNNAVAMLTGRDIVCGAPTFLYYHGVDYYERYEDVRRMYEDPEYCFYELAKRYGVDYVLIGPWERSSYVVDSEFFEALDPVWQGEGVTVYRLRTDN